jgi:hypothetical protein
MAAEAAFIVSADSPAATRMMMVNGSGIQGHLPLQIDRAPDHSTDHSWLLVAVLGSPAVAVRFVVVAAMRPALDGRVTAVLALVVRRLRAIATLVVRVF